MVTFERRGRIGVLTIDRPERRNAIDGAVARTMGEGLDAVEHDPDLWVGVLRAEGPVFCAGADLGAISEGRGHELVTERGGFAGIVSYPRRKPLVVAVDGPAVAGGCEVVLACDLVVASTAASFGLPEAKRGLLAGAGGLFRLPRVLPRNVALELAVTGDPISAERAHHLGMVNELTEPGGAFDAAVALAERIAANAPLAVQEARRQVIELALADDEAGLAEGVRGMQALAATEDYAEGPRAFLEKRPPRWTGR